MYAEYAAAAVLFAANILLTLFLPYLTEHKRYYDSGAYIVVLAMAFLLYTVSVHVTRKKSASDIAVVLFLFRDRIRTEYEYTFTNGQMDFAQVFNNKKRKNLGTMNIRNVEALGLVNTESFRRYLEMKDVKRSNWFINRDAQLFYFYFSKDNQKRLIIIEVSDEMHKLIKRYAAQGTYRVN